MSQTTETEFREQRRRVMLGWFKEERGEKLTTWMTICRNLSGRVGDLLGTLQSLVKEGKIKK